MMDIDHLGKYCPVCGQYNDLEDDPELEFCPFCGTKLIENYIIHKFYFINGGFAENKFPKSRKMLLEEEEKYRKKN